MSAIRNNDRVGAVLFTDRIEHVVPPRKGRRHALRLMRDLLAFEPAGTGTDIAGAMRLRRADARAASRSSSSSRTSRTRSIEQPLKLLAQRHDVVAVTVDDPSERELPDIGLARFVDPETGDTLDVDTSDPATCARASPRRWRRRSRRAQQLLRRLAIDEISCTPTAAYVEPLLRFFRTRETRRGTGDHAPVHARRRSPCVSPLALARPGARVRAGGHARSRCRPAPRSTATP